MLVFSLATGGFEEDKLIGEMYLGKRFQSRNDSFKSQAEMAVDSYQLAAQTHNILLAKCSEALVKRLAETKPGSQFARKFLWQARETKAAHHYALRRSQNQRHRQLRQLCQTYFSQARCRCAGNANAT